MYIGTNYTNIIKLASLLVCLISLILESIDDSHQFKNYRETRTKLWVMSVKNVFKVFAIRQDFCPLLDGENAWPWYSRFVNKDGTCVVSPCLLSCHQQKQLKDIAWWGNLLLIVVWKPQNYHDIVIIVIRSLKYNYLF